MEDRNARWETVVGLETHVELATRSKLFCSCSAAFGTPPNQNCCPLCLGEPGSRPVLNEEAVELAVRAALALGCRVETVSAFDRKHYSSPDLPRGYQITQFYRPLARDGAVRFTPEDGRERTVRIAEMHLEDDAGRRFHDRERGCTCIDFNRSGVPLIEIVTRPDFSTGDEVVAYLEELRSILTYLEVSDCKLQEGSLRCDVNLSVRPVGGTELGTRTEMKNLGSLRAIRKAVAFERERQIRLLESGGQVVQETRRWDEDTEQSLPMRAKEDARDYRYLPEPDLPELVLSQSWVDDLRWQQPELAAQKRERYMERFGLSAYEAGTLTRERALAEYFEQTVACGAPAGRAAAWIMGQVLRQLSRRGWGSGQISLSPATLARIIGMVEQGKISRAAGVQVLDGVFEGGDPEQYVAERALGLVSDTGVVDEGVQKVLVSHPRAVAEFREGKEKAFGFLMGQVMHVLHGKAAPGTVRRILRERLNEMG